MANANALALNKALNFTAWGVFADIMEGKTLLATFDTKAAAARYIMAHGMRAVAWIERI
jgi:carbon starvation protein CstA